ncbi:MAG TPA: GTPase RsgA [Desulfurococcales archaeon]|nr:GTPase RsgA [Desulfurococcales archaeon]
MILASWRTIRRVTRLVDVVLEVLDARDPVGTRSRKLERIVEREGKKLIIVINKADLVPREILEKWKRIFESEGYPTVYISARDRLGTSILRKTILKIADKKGDIVKVAVVGFPKVGKSTIINVLKGKHSASTSPIPGSPGYTKSTQWYRVDKKILILDTPGILPVKGDDIEAAIRGKAPDELKDPVKPAIELLKRALKYNPNVIRETYGISETDPYKILVKICEKRHWYYKKDREPLIEEAAKMVIRDWHRAKLVFYIRPEEYLKSRESSNSKPVGNSK